MAKTIKKTTHHQQQSVEIPPMGVVIKRKDPRILLYQIIIPFMLASFLGVGLGIGAVQLYRSSLSILTRKQLLQDVRVLGPKGNTDDIRHSLRTIAALYVTPIDLVTLIDQKNTYTLVDLRPSVQFEKAHIKTAVNIPDVTKSSIKSIQTYPVILYGDSPYAQSTFEAATVFASAGKDVRILTVGWNEFRFFPNIWMPEDWWNRVQIEDYLQIMESN